MSYLRVKKNWETGLWGIQHLKIAYKKGVITKEQYEYIITLEQRGKE